MIINCRTCGTALSHTRDNFYFENKAKGKLHRQCISCANAYAIKRHVKSERITSANVCWLSFNCSCCETSFPHWFKSAGKGLCRACEDIKKKNRCGKPAPKDTAAYREQMFRRSESRYLKKYCGVSKCVQCGEVFDPSTISPHNRGWQCNSCWRISHRMHRQMAKKFSNSNLSYTIRRAIKRGKECNSLFEALGYTIADLKAHLQRQFISGMDWARFNAGEIHIDHIVPQREFDMGNPEEFARCWCLSNLRPIWSTENMQKSGRRTFLL